MSSKRYWHVLTFAKVLAIAVLAVCAMAYLFGFASVLFDTLAAGYAAAGLTVVIGIVTAIAMIVRDVRRNRSAKELKE